MKRKIVIKFLLLYVFVNISEQNRLNSDERSCEKCSEDNVAHIRLKRAKFYPTANRKYFRRPVPPKGLISYTPPPNYSNDDDKLTYSGSSKVHYYKKPNTRNNLDDEDINNLIKNLSKDDLDRILEFANEKDKESKLYTKMNVNYNVNTDVQDKINTNNQDTAIYGTNEQNQFIVPNINNVNGGQSNMTPEKDLQVLFTDSKDMKEEVLPKPVNLREEPGSMGDYEVADTNKVPRYAQPGSYKVENFGDLPLSDYDSKLSSVSSYHVPHFTVTSKRYIGSAASASSNSLPDIEAAPPATSSAAHAHSDAHLKAVKIWTHRSKGTAYTLHRDGTLSLEIPSRPRPKYGHP